MLFLIHLWSCFFSSPVSGPVFQSQTWSNSFKVLYLPFHVTYSRAAPSGRKHNLEKQRCTHRIHSWSMIIFEKPAEEIFCALDYLPGRFANTSRYKGCSKKAFILPGAWYFAWRKNNQQFNTMEIRCFFTMLRSWTKQRWFKTNLYPIEGLK